MILLGKIVSNLLHNVCVQITCTYGYRCSTCRYLHKYAHTEFHTSRIFWILHVCKKLKCFNLGIIFFGERKGALRETGRGNIDLRESKLDSLDFSSVNGLSCITGENKLVYMLVRCRSEKI